MVPLAVQAGNRKPKRNGKVGPTRLALFRAYVSQTKLPGLQSSGLSRLVTFWAASGRTTFEAHLTDENLHARAGSGGKTTLLRTPLLSQSKARSCEASVSRPVRDTREADTGHTSPPFTSTAEAVARAHRHTAMHTPFMDKSPRRRDSASGWKKR